ncbi:MAG: hypothetical protein LBJ38_02050 [Oscillospiraceae bacterium]|nr:hypothetical protein [Oscillospiraceae bacterium]
MKNRAAESRRSDIKKRPWCSKYYQPINGSHLMPLCCSELGRGGSPQGRIEMPMKTGKRLSLIVGFVMAITFCCSNPQVFAAGLDGK